MQRVFLFLLCASLMNTVLKASKLPLAVYVTPGNQAGTRQGHGKEEQARSRRSAQAPPPSGSRALKYTQK